MKKINSLLAAIIFLFILASPCHAQKKESIFQVKKRHVVRSGPVFGVEKGQSIGIELGAEKQWKQLKFKNAPTIANAAPIASISVKRSPLTKYA